MAMSPMMGSPLDSPETDTRPGVSRPSNMTPEEGPTGGASESGEGRVSQVLMRVHGLEEQMDQLASTYPGAAPALRKAKAALRDAAKQIVASGSGPGQETPNPRMLG